MESFLDKKRSIMYNSGRHSGVTRRGWSQEGDKYCWQVFCFSFFKLLLRRSKCVSCTLDTIFLAQFDYHANSLNKQAFMCLSNHLVWNTIKQLQWIFIKLKRRECKIIEQLQAQHWLCPHPQGKEEGKRGGIDDHLVFVQMFGNIWLKVASMVLVGDARGKVAILVDDMADTCGTIVQVGWSLSLSL